MAFSDNLETVFLMVALNLGFVLVLRFVAIKVNLMDYPGGRKTHSLPTPLIGGVIIYSTILAAISIKNEWDSDFATIVLWAGAVFFIGMIDDFKHVPWQIRLTVQVIAALGVIFSTDITVTTLGVYPLAGPLRLGPLSVVFTIFAVAGLTNAYNLIDGINGLCGGLLLIPILALCLMSASHSTEIDFYLLIIVISLCIFLVFNLSNNPKINLFMGDAGSSGLGFIISFLIIAHVFEAKSTATPPVTLWLLMVPIMDTFSVIVRRTMRGQSIFQPGLDHLHHRLIKLGYSPLQTFLCLLLLASLSALIGTILNSASDIVSISAFLITVIFLPKMLALKEKKLS